MKRLAAQADYIASLEPDFQKLSDDELRGTTAALRERLENGEPLDELLFEAYAAVREARWRESEQRMFDVQMMGGIVLHEGDIAEMKTGEGKTFVAALALYPERASRHRRPPRHRQRLSGQARRGVEPARLRASRHDRRLHPEHDAVRGAQGGLRRRHHLRHELRVRLRLPARQHGRLEGRARPAQPRLRDRRRGRLDPDRRGAYAADHLRRARDRRHDLLRLRAHRQGADRPRPRRARARRARTRPSSPAPTTSTTRSTRPSRRRRPRSTRSSARSGSRTSTTRRTSSSSTT